MGPTGRFRSKTRCYNLLSPPFAKTSKRFGPQEDTVGDDVRYPPRFSHPNHPIAWSFRVICGASCSLTALVALIGVRIALLMPRIVATPDLRRKFDRFNCDGLLTTARS